MEEKTFQVLVVDDQPDIRDPLATYLKRHGFRVIAAPDARAARDALLRNAIDLMVLDVMMPGEDGMSLCRHVHATSKVPIIFLTAMADAGDRVCGLELGADDYMVKPFEPRELVARIRSVLRRTNMLPPKNHSRNGTAKKLAFDVWVLDLERRELLSPQSVSMPLSTADFRLLEVFIRRPNIVLTRDQLLDLTVGRSPQPFDRSIDNQISRLRKKIELDPRRPTVIKTVRRDGYIFAAEVRVVQT
jgi:two-component system OmpR family response regulator